MTSMKRHISLLVVLLVCFGWTDVFGQQESLFSQYMFNRLVINPAYAGTKGLVNVTALYRDQWVSWDGTPRTFTISGHGAVRKKDGTYSNHGIGMYAMGDERGALGTYGFGANYAFRIPLTVGSLAFGLQASALQWRLDGSKVNVRDANDPVFPSTTQTAWTPDFGAGAFFNTGKFYIGASVAHLVPFELDVTTTGKSKLSPHYFLTSGYDISLDKENNWILTPSFFFRTVGVGPAPVVLDLNMNLMMIQTFWVGASYRTEDALAFLAGFYPTKQLRLGVAYDVTLSNLNKPSYTGGSWEIMLSYDFGNPNKTRIVTPRYF
jgi:type IX secretion system PorP/SprF family membrane protein